jgi:hypothetical protein
MLSRLIFFIPEEAYLLVLVVAGVMMICGFRKAAFGVFSIVLFFAFLGPFFDSLIDGLPSWVFALLLFFVVISLLRMILGNGVLDHLVAMILFGFIRMPFRVLGWILRGFVPKRRP